MIYAAVLDLLHSDVLVTMVRQWLMKPTNTNKNSHRWFLGAFNPAPQTQSAPRLKELSPRLPNLNLRLKKNSHFWLVCADML